MLTFRQYITEAEKLGSLTVFDIDDTLFHTTAQIAVKKGGKVVRKLTNQEFNTYSLKAGESFDFNEFRDSEKFYQESKPITRMFGKAKAILKNSKRNPLSKVIVITARADFDDKHRFLETFKKNGLNIDDVRVERAGNINDIKSIAVKKRIIVRSYLLTGKYTTVRLFDDGMANLKEFLELQDDFPSVSFEAYFAKADGSIKTIKQ